MMIEEWKSIENYEGLYQVSNFGRVISLKNGRWGTGKERILKAEKNSRGYLQVNLWKEGKVKMFTIHRLVAQAFMPNPQNLPEINHRDEDKTNNSIENLEWCDRTYNCNYGTHNARVAKANTNRKDQSKRVICVETSEIFPSLSEVCRKFGYNKGHISSCCNGRYKTSYNYHWRYVE